MNSLDLIREQFRFNDWANRRMIVALKDVSDACPARARSILAHLLATEQEYFEHLYGKDSTGVDLWPDLTLEQCGSLARSASERYEKLLRGFTEDGLDITVKYRTTEGIPHQNTFREILTHVVTHSAIHRGNITILLRDSGFTPPSADYIIYLRETKYV